MHTDAHTWGPSCTDGPGAHTSPQTPNHHHHHPRARGTPQEHPHPRVHVSETAGAGDLGHTHNLTWTGDSTGHKDPAGAHRGDSAHTNPSSVHMRPSVHMVHRDTPHRTLNTWDPLRTPSPAHTCHAGTPQRPHTDTHSGDPTHTQDPSCTNPAFSDQTPTNSASTATLPTEPCTHAGPYPNSESPPPPAPGTPKYREPHAH